MEAANMADTHSTTRVFHPVSNIFPLLDGPAFDALVLDIVANGLREPITLHQDGSILDGRNRYRACLAAEVEPRFVTWDGQGSALAFVLSLNLHRRHLNESQRAMVAARVADLPRGANQHTAIAGTSQGDAAKLLNVSPDSVGRAREVLDLGTAELVSSVDRGAVSVSLAAKVAALPDDTQRAVVARVATGERPIEAMRQVRAEQIEARQIAEPTGKYRVVYADPPWSYGNRMPPGSTEPRDYYPTMPLADICALPVREMAEPDAVLFLWTTSPILEESFSVVRAWGFAYKSSFVWDKVSHNLGHYNSVRHELLLVATRGSCQPDVRKLFDSVVSEERTEHSRKPETFRTIIDTIYPHGTRIELFARHHAAGWDVWGLEAHVGSAVTS
jgi:N6-adenosine-specific RNA methylase IME4/ParB-like chromosome segregation protein Spo0J